MCKLKYLTSLLFQELGFRGFRVLGFPSDQFAGQELETNEQIKTFARETYSVNFDMFAKINVSHNLPFLRSEVLFSIFVRSFIH